jgi:hypothetical protein
VRNTVLKNTRTWSSLQLHEGSGQCLRSCGALGGTSSHATPCAHNSKTDAGQAYDVPYCCK